MFYEITLGTFVLFFIGTAVVYGAKIRQLEKKQYHLVMLALLLISYALSIVGQSLQLVSMTQDIQFSEIWELSNYFVLAGTSVDIMGHSVFAVKYWVISRKVKSY